MQSLCEYTGKADICAQEAKGLIELGIISADTDRTFAEKLSLVVFPRDKVPAQSQTEAPLLYSSFIRSVQN